MIRNIINISNHPYIVDILKAETDLKERYSANYVMLRSYDLTNDIPHDKDIYIIDKSILNEWMHRGIGTYPITNKKFIAFSESIYNFNEYFSDKDIYEIYNSNKEEADILCDVIRIYHPHTTNYGDAILYIDNYIGETHFHWFCRRMTDYDRRGAVQEFSINNFIYSEYIEFFIPSPEQIISEDLFYKEDTCVAQSDIENSNLIIEDGNYISMMLFNSFFKSEYKDGISIKKYIQSITYEIKLDYISHPINVTIYPYSEINEYGAYVEDVNRPANSDVFNYDTRISLMSSIGFDESGTISSINIFNFPNKNKFSSFREAYSFYYGVDLSDYVGIIDDEADDYNEEDPQEQKQCGFEMQIFRDREEKYSIGKVYFEIDDPDKELDDFSFSLLGIFNDWRQFDEYDCLIIQTKFIDKYLGITIKGNSVYIDKEHFKYMLNDPNEQQTISISGSQEKISRKNEMDLNKFNFIDKFNCIIKKTTDDNLSGSEKIERSNNAARIMYKPIFFKAYDLQNIFVRSGLKQNIGINLSDYMTKVETFRIIINGMQISEGSRNEVYVIFPIDGSLFGTNLNGEYHIVDQDDNYISSGSWSIK